MQYAIGQGIQSKQPYKFHKDRETAFILHAFDALDDAA